MSKRQRSRHLMMMMATVIGASFLTDHVLAQPDIVINEIRIDQPSTDTDEYFELKGPPGSPLDGFAYALLRHGQRETHEILTRRAESRSRDHHHVRLGEKPIGDCHRVAAFRALGPDVERGPG